MPWIKSCLCHQEKKRTPTISPPIHLLLKPDGHHSSGPSHAFRCKVFKKPRPCHLCHQPILNQGSCCRVCKYVCHKVCESKEAADRFSDTSWQIHREWNKNQQSPTNSSSQASSSPPPNLTAKDISGPIIANESVKCNGDTGKNIVSFDSSPSAAVVNGGGPKSSAVKSNPIVQSTKCATRNATETVVLHTHDVSTRNGHGVIKMSASHSGGFGGGEALTSQPRSTRSGGGLGGAAGGMDLSYVTERIIALWFPSTVTTQSYRQAQRQAAHMLRNKHGDNYMVFNLSEPRRAARNEHEHIREVGWPARMAPPLERLCSVCKEIDSWLSADKHRIAVLHARGSKDRLGVVVAAYMHYSSICGTADQALDRFSMRRFLEDNIGPLELPSNKRYVDYFSGLLSHNIRINAAPLYLTHVTVLGSPNFQQGGCRAFLKLYEGQTPVYTSGVYSVSGGVQQFTVNVAGEGRRGLQLRGDILMKCYHRGIAGRECIFACQFHTCAVADYTLSFTRQELDGACTDPRFPADGAVELHFSSGPEGRLPAPAPTPAVPVILSDDPVTRADSPIRLESDSDEDDSDSEDNHTFGPLDGSIYATIAKKPELSPGAVSSPLTVSMDSGISSAGHQQHANTNASTSPPPTAQPSPLTPEDQHRELDELLSDMMLTVQSIPDLKPRHQQQQSQASPESLIDNVRFIDEDDHQDKSIPYHARQDSRPFSYGTVLRDSGNMIGDSKGLSSPSLVRKASFNKSSGDTLKKVQTQVFPDASYRNRDVFGTSQSPYTLKKDPIEDIFTRNANDSYRRDYREEYYKDEVKRYDPLRRSKTEGTILRRSPEKITSYKTSNTTVTSPFSDSESLSPPGGFRTSPRSPEFHETYATSGNLTWLQRQQIKLKERREMQLREERQPHETRLISELRNVQSHRHMRPTASHRLDGYTSDTTAFADDDEDFTIPLHINTAPKTAIPPPGSPPARTSSRKYASSYSSTTSTLQRKEGERPFMAVKRAHELSRKYDGAQSPPTSPASQLAANPLGHVVRPPSRGTDSVDSGLLSLVEQEQYNKHSPRYNGAALVGIDNSHHDALAELIASLSNGSDKSDSSSNSCWPQYREESISSWRTQSASEMDTSPPRSVSPRPQTPAFPVHPRTPYINSSTPTPTVQFDLPAERLPPKSPTTQRRLSYPTATSSLKLTKKSSYSPDSKDRSHSPLTNGSTNEYIQRSYSTTPPNSAPMNGNYQHSPKSAPYNSNGSASPTVYYGNSRRSSLHSNSEPPQEVSPAHVKFVRDTSRFWYKPTISREEAINMLRNQPPGTFVVRDSNSFPGAFGMALKVASPPPNVLPRSPNNDELVRHFLIEPTSRGVRLKGCQNEPVFSSLSALVYQHSITQMALPCRLLLPEGDVKANDTLSNPAQQLLSQGAACNVLFLFTIDMESLTGPQAIRKAALQMFQNSPLPQATVVHFKVSGQGITLTDNKRKLFFRRHYPINAISHCGLDPDDHRWTISSDESGIPNSTNRVFGFVARKSTSKTDNQCHLFAEYEPEQPATAIVNFVIKMMNSSGTKSNIV